MAPRLFVSAQLAGGPDANMNDDETLGISLLAQHQVHSRVSSATMPDADMFIRGVGTAAPATRYTKAECLRAFEQSDWFGRLDARSHLIARTVLQRDNGIDARRLAVATLGALARGVAVHGELLGYGLTTDAGHIARPSADGQATAMSAALAAAGIAAAEVDAINAHGTGTQANDAAETAAIKHVFGARAGRIPISATKALHGHLLGAAGALEFVLSLLALQHGVALPTMHLDVPDPDCDLDYVAGVARVGAAGRTMLSNSFAFGGTNAVLALRAVG